MVMCVALQEGAGHSLGWLTTNERKESMCLQLRDALRVGSIALSSGFFSTSVNRREILQQLDGELVCDRERAHGPVCIHVCTPKASHSITSALFPAHRKTFP